MDTKEKETLESLIEADIKKMFSDRGDRQVNINYIKEELKKYYNLGAKDVAEMSKEKIQNAQYDWYEKEIKTIPEAHDATSEALILINNSLIEITK